MEMLTESSKFHVPPVGNYGLTNITCSSPCSSQDQLITKYKVGLEPIDL